VRFVDTAVNKEKRYCIGREADSGRYYLAIPATNGLVDYEEYYEISAEAHDAYPGNAAQLEKFADECRKRQHDERLIYQPSITRGAAT
jgi:hypothetical protein